MPVLLVYGVAYSIDRLAGQRRPSRFCALRHNRALAFDVHREYSFRRNFVQLLVRRTEVYAPLYESLHLRKRQIIAHNV